MKRLIGVGMITVCLITPSFSWIPDDIVGWEYFEDKKVFPDEKVIRLREEFKDTKRLKEYLEGLFLTVGVFGDVPPLFRQKFGVSEKIMQTALTNILHESSAKVGWEALKEDETDDISGTKLLLIMSIDWLGACADTEVKKLLIDIATDGTKGGWHRENAIGAYLRRADAQEVRDGLTVLLVDKRLDVSRTYNCAMRAYDEAKENTGKRNAIIATLSTALIKEKDKTSFLKTDKWLSERSKEYAESPQRKAALERMNKPPEKKTP